jgi:hypothetical protein
VRPQPIWWTGPVTAATDGETTVLVGAGQPVERWRERASTAVTQVRRRVTTAAVPSWRPTVVEVPASRRDFEAVVGAADGSYAAIAAVTLAEGPSATAAVRVVVNPEVTRQLAPLGIAVVLTHEVVHVATRSADSPAPTWAVEGFADYIALTAYPAAGDGAGEPLLQQVRRSGAPEALPDDERFRAGQPDLAASYAGAWLACRSIAAAYGPAALQRFYAALDAGRTFEQAAEDELGVPAATVTEGWRTYLRQQAGG